MSTAQTCPVGQAGSTAAASQGLRHRAPEHLKPDSMHPVLIAFAVQACPAAAAPTGRQTPWAWPDDPQPKPTPQLVASVSVQLLKQRFGTVLPKTAEQVSPSSQGAKYCASSGG